MEYTFLDFLTLIGSVGFVPIWNEGHERRVTEGSRRQVRNILAVMTEKSVFRNVDRNIDNSIDSKLVGFDGNGRRAL